LKKTKAKILIVKFRNIGDVFLSTALVKELKMISGDLSIHYAINGYCKDVLVNNPYIDSVHFYERNRIKHKNILSRIFNEIKFILQIRNCKYDFVINLTEGDRGIIIGLLSGAREIFSYPSKKKLFAFFKKVKYNTKERYEHSVTNDLSFAKFFSDELDQNNDIYPEIYYSKNDEDVVDKFIRDKQIEKFAIVHPVSRWFFKCWDDNKVADIIEFLHTKKGLEIILTSSSDFIEAYKCKSIENLVPFNVTNLSGELTLNQLSLLIKKSSLFFGIDSAPMHIAASLKIPLVTIFGASYPSIWGPWSGKENHFQNSNGIQKFDNNVVIVDMNHETYYRNLDKLSRGMDNIKVSDVKKAINRIL